jgi:hypothetical protein
MVSILAYKQNTNTNAYRLPESFGQLDVLHNDVLVFIAFNDFIVFRRYNILKNVIRFKTSNLNFALETFYYYKPFIVFDRF